jgi:hypothetical protein
MLGLDSNFYYDVYLTYSIRDKAVVRETEERLRTEGLRVWFDEWVFKPGDSIRAKIDKGLERSRVLMPSNCAQLESSTFRFRDPLCRERLFLPCATTLPSIKDLPGAR